MELNVRTYDDKICEISVKSDHRVFTHDISFFNSETSKFEADAGIIDNLITTAFDISRFNKKSDIEMVKEIFEAFLSSGEQEQFLHELKSK